MSFIPSVNHRSCSSVYNSRWIFTWEHISVAICCGARSVLLSAELPLLDIKLPFWMYGRNLIFLDAYYLLAETVEAHTLKNIGSSEDWNTIMNMESILNILMKDYS